MVATRYATRGEAEYETLRTRLWRANVPARFPEEIVPCTSPEEVAEAVRHARRRHLPIAVRAGGHHWSATSLRDGGLLLDIGGLRELRVEASARTAAVGPGVTSAELIERLEPEGLAFPVGHCPDVRLSGFLLNGGIGWNVLNWGPSCLSVRAIDVVTADGEIVRADGEHHPELFWAARGSGPGFFGVAVRFHLALYPRPRSIRSSALVFPIASAPEVGRSLQEAGGLAASRVEAYATAGATASSLRARAGAPPVGLTVHATAFGDSDDATRAALTHLEGLAARPDCVAKALDEPTPYPALFALAGELWPPGHRLLGDQVWANAGPAVVFERLRDLIADPPGSSFVMAVPVPPPPAEAPPLPEMAFSKVGPTYVGLYTIWKDPAEDPRAHAWFRDASTALGPLSAGRYVGETDLETGTDRLASCFGDAQWKRLAAVRAQYDPEGRFYSFPTPEAPAPTRGGPRR